MLFKGFLYNSPASCDVDFIEVGPCWMQLDQRAGALWASERSAWGPTPQEASQELKFFGVILR